MQANRISRRLIWIVPAVLVYGVVFICNDPLGLWARSDDPAALLERALSRARDVRDYTCLFVKEERLDGRLKPAETIRVRYRESPLSVYMEWVDQVDSIRRATYVSGRHVDSDGREQAVVEPAGALVRLVASEVKIPIHGKRARAASRRTIDEFGFRYALDQIVSDNREFAAAGVIQWEPVRAGRVGQRPTLVLVRHLPYEGPEGPYPDARLEVHLDREWLLPVELRSYADPAGEVLLERYTTLDVVLNPGLADADFDL